MDKIFKIGLLVLGFSYLAYLFCPVANQVGRYSFWKEGDLMNIMDTTNANVYMSANFNEWTMFNPITGKAKSVEILPNPKKTNK